MENIFAWFGAIVALILSISLLIWLCTVFRNDINRRYHESRDEKLELYDELARKIDDTVSIIVRDDWNNWIGQGYTFEKLAKEIIESRKAGEGK